MKNPKRTVWHEIVIKRMSFQRRHAVMPNRLRIPLRLWERMLREALEGNDSVSAEVRAVIQSIQTPMLFGPSGWNPGVTLFGMSIAVNEGGNFEVTYKAP